MNAKQSVSVWQSLSSNIDNINLLSASKTSSPIAAPFIINSTQASSYSNFQLASFRKTAKRLFRWKLPSTNRADKKSTGNKISQTFIREGRHLVRERKIYKLETAFTSSNGVTHYLAVDLGSGEMLTLRNYPMEPTPDELNCLNILSQHFRQDAYAPIKERMYKSSFWLPTKFHQGFSSLASTINHSSLGQLFFLKHGAEESLSLLHKHNYTLNGMFEISDFLVDWSTGQIELVSVPRCSKMVMPDHSSAIKIDFSRLRDIMLN